MQVSSNAQAIASKEKELQTAQAELDGLRQQCIESTSSMQSNIVALESQLLEAKLHKADLALLLLICICFRDLCCMSNPY